MRSTSLTIISALITALVAATAVWAQGTVAVAVPAKAGAVDGTAENSDAFIWRLFTEFMTPVSKGSPSPVVFETWASDKDTFSTTPHWPQPGESMQFQSSVLGRVKTLNSSELMSLRALTIDEPCKAPPGAAVGGFPTSGTPTPCIAEQVARNRPQFDYIVKNNLNTQAGLVAAYAKSFKVEMPLESIALKGDWIPLPSLLKYIGTIRKLYYTATVSSVEYALVAMHVSSRQNPNWVWGTFEHQMNPGRCDAIGCFDSFGAQIPSVPPSRTAVNAQYGPCPKTQRSRA
jgi:hypothetical protein